MSAICRVAQRVLRVVPCASTLLSWADKAASYVLAYTVAFIGIYGLSFKEGTRMGSDFTPNNPPPSIFLL